MATRMYSAAETGVLWDLEYCPIPDGLTPALVSQNIKSALKNMGYTGEMSIRAYSLTKPKNKKDFESAGITLCYSKTSNAKFILMYMEAFAWAIKQALVPANLMLISDDMSKDRFYVAGLQQLKEKANNILLAQPQAAVGLLRTIPSAIWLWSSLSAGGSPVDNQSGSSQVLTPCLTTSSTQSKTSLRVADKKKKKPLVLEKKKKLLVLKKHLDKKRKRKTKD